MTILIPMSTDDFQVFAKESVPLFAAEKIVSGQWAESEALAPAQKSFDEGLPQGLATPDNYHFSIHDEVAKINIGMIWIAAQDRGGKRIANLYEIKINPEHQRQGHATRALNALALKVSELGLSGIALHVFGHNIAAQALYVKLGYLPTNINMFKTVSAAGAIAVCRAAEADSAAEAPH